MDARRRRRQGWTMALVATVATVAAFWAVGPWAYLLLAVAFTLVVFGTLALIVACARCGGRSSRPPAA